MNTDLSWQRRFRRVLTACAGKWEQSYSIAKVELLVVGITVPTLGVLAVLLGDALGVSVLWSQAAATILGLVLVSPFMLRSMQYSTPRKSVDTLFIAPTLRAPDAKSSSVTQDYEGWSGQMENSTSLSDLTGDQLELISELLATYQEVGDLNQLEWATVQSALEIVDARLEEV